MQRMARALSAFEAAPAQSLLCPFQTRACSSPEEEACNTAEIKYGQKNFFGSLPNILSIDAQRSVQASLCFCRAFKLGTKRAPYNFTDVKLCSSSSQTELNLQEAACQGKQQLQLQQQVGMPLLNSGCSKAAGCQSCRSGNAESPASFYMRLPPFCRTVESCTT